MKLTGFFILAISLNAAASGFSQNISLNKKDVPLDKVFREIKKQSGYTFAYTRSLLKKAKPVTINITNATIENVLAICFNDQPLDYKIINQTVVVINKKEVIPEKIILPPTPASINITGKITNEKGEPLAGATVTVKGTKNVAVTKEDGSFEINVASAKDILVITYVGYKTKELALNGQTNIQTALTLLNANLSDIVVVGYGTQRKANLTGSVATITTEEINKRAAPNAANLLQGKITGLEVVQPSGNPGDVPSVQIRGLGSFGASSAPLVLIDGVIGDLNAISPNDIDNVSILKDAASASIYGNRAANGVILVTTKRGKSGGFNIVYNNNISTSKATRLPDLVYNSVEYMEMYNSANLHSGLPAAYTQAQIDLYKNAPAGSLQYPNYNWIDHYIKNSSLQDHHLGISGGSNNTNYNLSFSFLTQDGIIRNHGYDRYNMIFSIDSRLNSIFKIGSTVSFNKSTIKAPGFSGDNLVLDLYQNAPTYGPFLPDGSGRLASNDFIGSGAFHIFSIESILQGTKIKTDNYEARTQAYIEANLLKGLTWLVKGAFNYNDQFYNNRGNTLPEYYYQPNPSGVYQFRQNSSVFQLGVLNSDSRNLYLNAYTTLNYNKTILKDHHFNLLGGYSAETFTNQILSGARTTFPSVVLTQLNSGATTGQTLNGNSFEYALQSVFGRLNYNYKEKYLLEIDSRYDGSSRIAPDKRYGLFPSISAGWRISQEDFIKNIFWIDNLKLRASYGRLGNQEIGNYPYQDVLNIVSYSFGNQRTVQGAQLQNLRDKNLKWETTDIADIGLDANLKNGLLSFTIDWYNKKTTGILTRPTILNAVGLNAPTTNFGTLQNRGIELNISHTNNIGKYFKYSLNALVTRNRNKLLEIAATQDKGLYIDKVGEPYDSYYITEWTGIFQSADDIAKSPTHPFNPKPGDLKFKDFNGDNKIDANDRQITTGFYPDFTYSFSLNLSYKQFSISTFLQGVQGIKRYVSGFGAEPFWFGSPPPTYFRNAWTPENHSQKIPALYNFFYLPVNGTNSTYFLEDASYLRIKNIQLTYELPAGIAKKIFMKSATVHVSADNLFTFTKFIGDPERNQYDNTYANYPQTKIFSAGLNLQF